MKGKFRNWLIKKLGGFTINEMLSCNDIYGAVKLTTIKASYMSNRLIEDVEERDYINREIAIEIAKQIKPTLYIEKRGDLKFYVGEILISTGNYIGDQNK